MFDTIMGDISIIQYFLTVFFNNEVPTGQDCTSHSVTQRGQSNRTPFPLFYIWESSKFIGSTPTTHPCSSRCKTYYRHSIDRFRDHDRAVTKTRCPSYILKPSTWYSNNSYYHTSGLCLVPWWYIGQLIVL